MIPKPSTCRQDALDDFGDRNSPERDPVRRIEDDRQPDEQTWGQT
jgi:hypothetical protein